MDEEGFRVTLAKQSRTRIPGKAPFTRHMLRLRHVDHLDAHGEAAELVLVNSHVTSSAYRLFSGVFRVVCENGMIIQSADFGSFAIRHSGHRDLFAQIKEATARIMGGIPAIMNRIETWKGIILPRPMQIEMAHRTAELKPNAAIKPAFLPTARREEDATGPDFTRHLWTTTNVLQENLMRGGLSGVNARGRKITTRAIKSVNAYLDLNRQLWQIAEQVAEWN
jgi:hypothetical protein